MALSIFEDKSHQPTPEDLEEALGASYDLWKQIVVFVHRNYPATIEEWKHPGKNWGWGIRWEVKTPDQLKDIETLILIKISN